MANSINKDTLLFSKISGSNLYLIDNNDDGKRIFAHHFNDENTTVDIKIVKVNSENIDLWKKFVFNPPNIKYFRWPCDIVSIENTTFSKAGNLGLVFLKKDNYKKPLTPLKNVVYNDRLYGADNECEINMKNLLINILTALTDLEEKGFLFVSFDLEKMYFNENDYSVYFDFPLSTVALDCNNINKKYNFFYDDISIDFIPPWAEYSNVLKVNKKFAYYSVAALLFKLLIGRMPYQGSLFDGCGAIMSSIFDNDYNEHINRMKEYYKFPIFIFDDINKKNSIGVTAEEQDCVARYESLTSELRYMFANTFKIVADTNSSKELFSFEKWLKAIKSNFNEEI